MIDVIDLRKNFHDLEVLKGINFKVEKGDIGRPNIRKNYF